VAPLLEALGNITGARVHLICAGMQEYFRDISDHLLRLNQTIESVRDTISTAISVSVSMINLQESETMKRLASYAALIAVPTLVAGVYGMNFDYMPELRWHYGYPVSIGLMAIADLYLFFRFKKAKWL
jgi:magnesium transporter